MQLDHPKLKTRLEQVIGDNLEPYLQEVAVLGVNLHGFSAIVELKINFSKKKNPRNFHKKSRNCLILFLHIPDFEMSITRHNYEIYKNVVDILKNDKLQLNIGKYQYEFNFDTIELFKIESVNKMNLVDDEY